MNLAEREKKAEEALAWLHGKSESVGIDAANVEYTAEWCKIKLAECKKLYVGLSNAAAEDEAKCHPVYKEALQAFWEAKKIHETNRMKKAAAEGYLAYFQTSSSNARANV